MYSATINDRAKGSIIGLAIGDAFGAPYEFKAAPYPVSEEYIMLGPDRIPCGVWTDDTSMELCLAQSLIDCGGFNAGDQMNKYLMWRNDGYLSSVGFCFDIGLTIAAALNRYTLTGEPYCGSSAEESAGNGSLMRLAPIAVYYWRDRNALKRYAAESSLTTHAAQLAVDSCVFFAQLVAGAIEGHAKEELLSMGYADLDGMRDEVVLIANGSYKDEKAFLNTGFVLHTLEAALMAFYRFDNFRDGILHLASLGGDVDTVCAVYGQIAGAFYGYNNLCGPWLDRLVKKEIVEGITSSLVCASEAK